MTAVWSDAVREAVLNGLSQDPLSQSATVDAVLAALEPHVVPRAEHDNLLTFIGGAAHAAAEVHVLRRAVLDLAEQWRGERFPGGLSNPARIADAHTLRALVDDQEADR